MLFSLNVAKPTIAFVVVIGDEHAHANTGITLWLVGLRKIHPAEA
tara:strand:+ start:351 stop:485 length:135 start_codon:yes stop_codon:yes gene_type:complete